MGLFSKRNKNQENLEPEDGQSKESTQTKVKPDKSFKPRSPKAMGLKRFTRVIFWVFVGFVLVKGIVSFSQGTRIIEKVTQVGNNTPVVSESVKGFATDFATEYFTWTINNANERNVRLEKFISGIDEDAGIKYFDIQGASRVLSADVYTAEKIDDTHYDVTIVVRRDIELLPTTKSTDTANAASTDSKQVPATDNTQAPKNTIKKTYMVVPVLSTSNGLLIHTYPRFVSEQQKGDTDTIYYGQSVSDPDLIQKGTELTDSFLRSYFAGNASQLKYFYADNVIPEEIISNSEFTLEKVIQTNIYQTEGVGSSNESYIIIASVNVKNDIGETFINSWTLNATLKEGRLYVVSLGSPALPKQDVDSKTTVPSQINNNEPINSSPAPTEIPQDND